MLEPLGAFSQAKPNGSPNPCSSPTLLPVITDRSLLLQVEGIILSYQKDTLGFPAGATV
jgi:hypothetical protein